MKDLKFRAYHKPTKQLFDVTMIDFINAQITVKSQNAFIKTYYWLNDCVLMQYTGLKDCENGEIFKGDIIVIQGIYPFYEENNLNYIGVVEFIYSQWQYVLKCVNPGKKGISNGMNNILNDEGYEENAVTPYKILGNIYQNKQLLKEINK